jgi:hypothetical protein
MTNTIRVLSVSLLLACAGIASAAPIFTTDHGLVYDFDAQIAQDDLIAGMIAIELPGDTGWHPANTDPLDQLPALTDGDGLRAPGALTGLLNDFPGAGNPTKLIQYDLANPSDVSEIRILTGNEGGDGRIFSTTVIKYSTDNGANFDMLGYFQSDPSGTLNNAGSDPRYYSTLVTITDDSGGPLAAGVTNIEFDLYAVDNTGGQMRDPFDGMNPFTGADDGLTAAFVSPLVWELDVIPEPASLSLLLLGGFALLRRR